LDVQRSVVNENQTSADWLTSDGLRFQSDAVPQKMIATKSRDAILKNDNCGSMTTNDCSKSSFCGSEILMLLQILIDAATNVR
jgi:hypothetical protein